MLGPWLRLCLVSLLGVVARWVEAVKALVAMPCLVVDVMVDGLGSRKFCVVDEYLSHAP